MKSLHATINILRKYKASDCLTALFALVLLLFAYLTYASITSADNLYGPNPNIVINFLLVDLISLFGFVILATRKLFKKWLGRKYDGAGVRLQNRTMLVFCLVVAIPTITISVFSCYFFNFGIQSWFGQKVEAVLDQSVKVGESYAEHSVIQMKETAVSVADDLINMPYHILDSPHKFSEILDGEVETRSLSEAMVFQHYAQTGANIVLAQNSMSFSLAFSTMPDEHLIKKADKGGVVEIKDPSKTKIRMLIKLHEYGDTYLLIGKLIDQKIIDHLDQTHSAVGEYLELKGNITKMQIKFTIIFILGAMILLLLTICCGMVFAAYIVKPIKNLVLATERVKSGDLTARVEEGPQDDELAILSRAFNRMIKQIDHQQKDLIIAQRALAWSDVARRVAHEIKNPLTPIQLSAERLEKKFRSEVKEPEEFSKYVQTILRHTQDIGRIVSEFVNFAKMPNPTFENVELIGLLGKLVESRKILNDKVTYNFVTDLEKVDFICDITQINQVMVNLLKNAEEALETCSQKIITVSIIQDSHLLYVTVKDSGAGIAPEMINHITEPYVTTRTKGTGLGLAIVQKIIQDHAGLMDITNDNGASIKLVFDLEQLGGKMKG